MIKTICSECNSRVVTCRIKNCADKNKQYKAFCSCSDVPGRSEKRALKAFKRFNQTYETS